MSSFETCLQMNFYITLLCFTFTISFSIQKTNQNLKVVKLGVGEVTPNAAGLVLFAEVNNTSGDVDYKAEVVPDRCCLKQEADSNCDVIEIIGDSVQTIPKGQVATFKLVVPLIDVFERYGHCTAYLDTKDVENKRIAMRNNIEIPFDTRLSNVATENFPYVIKKCKRMDQDPLNNCKPVDCKTFYNDKRPFLSTKWKRCTDAPSCVSGNNDMPISIYDPIQNKCIGDPITKDDIEYIKHNRHDIHRVGKDIKKRIANLPVSDDLHVDDINPYPHDDEGFNLKKHKKREIRTWLCAILETTWGLISLLAVISFQCCLICTLISCYCPNFSRRKKEKVENTTIYMNPSRMRQDASDITPLIAMSNEIATTGQFHSDSSSMERKIHCYRACEKENQKCCLSDDVLLKCVNRRNWNSRSDEQKDNLDDRPVLDLYCAKEKEKTSINFESEKRNAKGKCKTTRKGSAKKSGRRKDSAVDVETSKKIKEDFDSEIPLSEQDLKTYSCTTQTRGRIEDRHHRHDGLNVFNYNMEPGVSEKEMKCYSFGYHGDNSESKDIYRKTDGQEHKPNQISFHSYRYDAASSGISLKESSISSEVKNDVAAQNKDHSYNYNIKRSGRSSRDSYDSSSDLKENNCAKFRSDASRVGAGDTLKEQASAQASFPNDSLDDFLSERGMLFATGERNMSKYSYSNQSLRSTTLSSKTSKNNMLKNILSYIKRGRPGPSSEPGTSKIKDDGSVHMELIHMSRATMYSSSVNDNEGYKSADGPRHSTTSI